MAGSCKPSVAGLGREASYTVLDLSSSQGSGGTVESCGLFNGTNPDEWNTENVFYWYDSTNYLEIEIEQNCNIWRCGTYNWATSNGTLNVFLYNESTKTYDDITSIVTQTTTTITNSSWEKTFTGLKKGRYKFTTGNGLRLDSEWFIENTSPIAWDTTTKGSSITLSGDKMTFSGSASDGIKTNIGVTFGKYYMEYTIEEVGALLIGVCNETSSMTSYILSDTSQKLFYYNGNVFPSNEGCGLGALSVGSVLQVKLNADDKTITFGLNNTWSPNTFSLTGNKFYPVVRNYSSSSNASVTGNLGGSDFKYDIPDDYYAYNNNNIIPPMVWDNTTCGGSTRVDIDNPLKATTYYIGISAVKTNSPLGSGKYYFEYKVDYLQYGVFGICNESFNTKSNTITSANHVSLFTDGKVYPSANTAGCGAPTDGCIIGVKIDTINKVMSFAVNNKWGTEFAIAGTTFYPVLMNNGVGSYTMTTANFGATPFTYSAPDGYERADSSMPLPDPGMVWDQTTANTNVVVDTSNQLQVTVSSSAFNGVKTNKPLPSDKVYMEFTAVASNGGFIGICNESFDTQVWSGNDWTSKNQVSFYFSGGTIYPSMATSGLGGLTVGKTVGIKFDSTTRTAAFCIDGKWSADYGILSGTTFYPIAMNGSSGASSTILANFGATPFTYTIPDGYVSANSGGSPVVTYGLLLKSGDKYYSIKEDLYNSVNKIYNPIETVTKESFATYGFELKDLLTDVLINNETFKPISKFKTIKIVSHESFNPLTLNGIKSNKELIISRQNMNLMLTATTVNRFKQTFTKLNNGTVRLIFSLDNGTTWKTWNETNSAFEDLTSTLSLDIDPNNMTDEQLTQWNDFTNDAFTNGISPTVLETLDFTQVFSSTNKTVRFAFVISRPAIEDSITVANTIWNYDKRGRWYQLDSSEISIGITPDSCEVTALKEDLANVKLNILL